MKISDVNLKIILDSRGKETLSADIRGFTHPNFRIKLGRASADLYGIASVPSGKSKGTHEAFVLEPKKAIEKFKEVEPDRKSVV